MATLKEIAQKSGVSASVVSRILNPKPDKNARFSEETAEKVRAVADELGYRPNRAAQFLSRGKVANIGVFLPKNSDRLVGDLVIGISETAKGRGYPLDLNFGFDEKSFSKFFDNSINVATCGLITYTSFEPGSEIYQKAEKFQQQGGKIVFLNPYGKATNLLTISIDDVEGGRLAAERLISEGCEAFAVCGKFFGRNEGFKEKLSKKNMTVNFPDLAYGLDDKESFVEFVLKNKSDGIITGVFAVSDRIACIAARVLNEAGIFVGKDVKLIGYDDQYLASEMNPPLTTVRQPFYELGRRAVEVVAGMIDGETFEDEEIKPELVCRSSG